MKNPSVKWFLIGITLLLIFAFIIPVFMAAPIKGVYFILGGLIPLFFFYLAFKKADSITFMFNSEKRKSAPKLSNLKKFSLALLSVVNIGVVGGFISLRIDTALKEKGVIAVATISGGEHTTTKSLKRSTENSYSVDYSFTTEDGEKVEGSESVSSSEYNSLAVGSGIEVIYLPGHPSVMRLLISDSDKEEFKKE
mgnify:FL=1